MQRCSTLVLLYAAIDTNIYARRAPPTVLSRPAERPIEGMPPYGKGYRAIEGFPPNWGVNCA